MNAIQQDSPSPSRRRASLVTGAAAQTACRSTAPGATFPYPIYSKWFSEYNKLHPNVEINYQSIGSGGGIQQVTKQTVFFGATDGPMTAEQLQARAGKDPALSRPCSAPSCRSTTCPASPPS